MAASRKASTPSPLGPAAESQTPSRPSTPPSLISSAAPSASPLSAPPRRHPPPVESNAGSNIWTSRSSGPVQEPGPNPIGALDPAGPRVRAAFIGATSAAGCAAATSTTSGLASEEVGARASLGEAAGVGCTAAGVGCTGSTADEGGAASPPVSGGFGAGGGSGGAEGAGCNAEDAIAAAKSASAVRRICEREGSCNLYCSSTAALHAVTSSSTAAVAAPMMLYPLHLRGGPHPP